ncbi:MAG: adenylyl-sulfate kinase [Bacteroidales bacterium]|nr:adenylyl-sulfate kinase [Bacteroidales bacterium]
MFVEQKRRSIIKTISWRLWATITTIALVFLFVGEVKIALYIGAVEVVLKMILYFAHERIWNKIKFGKKEVQPAVYWFTGFSGSGKSTLSENFVKILKKKGLRVEHLDGDSVRDIFPKTGFSKEERNRHIKRVGFLASKLEKNGVFVIASFISPYQETRDFVRNLCDNFVEVHVSTPIEVCEKRDVKGLYKKARNGEITQFTGIDHPYEIPNNPEITIDTTHMKVEDSVNEVLKYFNSIK